MAGRLFEPQRVFRATAVNHISYRCTDYAKTRDWYMDLLGAKCEFDDGERCSVVFGSPLRGLYIGGTDKPAFVDHLAYSVADFDLKESEAALKKYGFEPKYDGEFAWTVTDINGYVAQVCAEVGVFPGAARPGASAAGKAPSGSAAQRPGVFQATAVNHISFQVPDYAKARDFYCDLFGMRVAFDDGVKFAAVNFGDEPEDALYLVQRGTEAKVDHLAISVADFDLEDSKKKLEAFGLEPEDDGDAAWTVLDPAGYRVQICAEKGVYPGAARDFFHQLPKN